MNKKLEERIKLEVKIKMDLEKDLSEAIGKVLKEYGVTGDYIFNVRKDWDYCHEPVEYLKGKKFLQPIWCLGSGCAKVEDPTKVYPI